MSRIFIIPERSKTESKDNRIMLKLPSVSLTWNHNGYYSLHMKSENLTTEDWGILEAVIRKITPDWFLLHDIRKDFEKECVWGEDDRWYHYGEYTQIMVPKMKRTAYYYIRTVS